MAGSLFEVRMDICCAQADRLGRPRFHGVKFPPNRHKLVGLGCLRRNHLRIQSAVSL